MIGYMLTVLIFLFPGILMLVGKNFFPTFSYVEKIPIVIALSLSYWIISFWFLAYLPIPLHLFLLCSLTGSLLYSCIHIFKNRRKFHLSSQILLKNILHGIWFIVLALPALILASSSIAPSGQDMTMHAYLAKAIYLTNGFPSTLEPIVPLTQFGKYPIGFPIIVSLLMRINSLPVYTNALWLSVFTYWYFSATLYTLLRSRFPFVISATTTILITWLSFTPRDIIEWGANPTVLSLDFLIIACIFFLNRKRFWHYLFFLISLYTAFLIHYMLPVAFFYIALFVSPFFYQSLIRTINTRRKILLAFALTSILIIPFVTYIPQGFVHISDTVYSSVKKLQQQEFFEWTGTIYPSFFFGIIKFLINTLGESILVLYVLSLAILARTKRRTFLIYSIYSIGIYLLIVNTRGWWLPLSSIMYPKRIVLLILIPASLSIAAGLHLTILWVYRRFVIHTPRNRSILYGLTILTLGYFYYPQITIAIRSFINSQNFNVVTQQDLQAMQWLTQHTNPNDVIVNNYNDAGLWIPAIAERSITTYHTNPIDMDLLQINLNPPTYAYIGHTSLTRLGTDRVNEEIANNPEKYILIYDKGGAKVYQLRTQN